MNDYLIKYKIATVSELVNPFQYEKYDFQSYDIQESWSCDAWVASRVISAKNAGEARYIFLNGLMPLVEHFSAISQCGFRFIANSYFIYKQTNNPKKIVYIYFVRPVSHTGLMFWKDEVAQLEKMKNVPNQKGFFYIMEAANATTFYTRLVMLIGAAEAFAGEVIVKRQKRTDPVMLEKILGGELKEKLYKYGDGLRNKLLHGTIEEQYLFEGINDEIYNKLRDYLTSEFDIRLEKNVVHPQRNFYGNFEQTSMYMRFKDNPILDLKTIEEAVDDRYGKQPNLEMKLFSYVGEQPKNY